MSTKRIVEVTSDDTVEEICNIHIDVAAEIAYWRSIYGKQPYYSSSRKFIAYEPAYRAGVEAFNPDDPLKWEEREARAKELYELESRTLSWGNAKVAARDAYNRLYRKYATT